ncbi:MAG: hypothetical protein ACLTFB_01090 [Candidatus Phytoplasma pyri]
MNSKNNVLNYLFTILNNFPDIEKYPNLTTLFKQITQIFHKIENDFTNLKNQNLKINEIDDSTNQQFFEILTRNLQISTINLDSMTNLIIKTNQVGKKILKILKSTKSTNPFIKYDLLTTNLNSDFYTIVADLNLIGILQIISELIANNECTFFPINPNNYSHQFQLFQDYLTNIQTNLTAIIKALAIINTYYYQILKNFKIPTSTPNRFIN